MSESEKTYTNGEITVIWKPGVCIHSAKCSNRSRSALPERSVMFGIKKSAKPQGDPWT